MPPQTQPNARQFEELLEELRGSAAAIGLGVAAAAESPRAVVREGDWGDGFAVLDPSLRFLFVNPVAARILGKSPATLQGASFLEEHPPRVRQALDFHLRRVLGGGATFHYESFSQQLGGWCEIHAWPVTGGMAAVQFRDSADSRGSRDRMEFLSNATEVMAASLDSATTLKTVARLAVPILGDYCLFDVADGAGRMRRVAWEHADPGLREFFDAAFASTTPDSFEDQPFSRLAASGKPEFEPDLTDEVLGRWSTGSRHDEFVRRTGPRSIVAAPVIARGRTLGALTFVFADHSGRRHTHADLDLAAELAGRTALALDNAVLHAFAERERAGALEAAAGRDQALLAARQGEDRFRFIAALVSEMLWLAGPDGTFEYAGGERFAEYTGITEEKLKSGGWPEALHPEDRAACLELWDRSCLTGEPFDKECRIRRADGEQRAFLVRARAMRGPGGRVVRWVGSLAPIEGQGRPGDSGR